MFESCRKEVKVYNTYHYYYIKTDQINEFQGKEPYRYKTYFSKSKKKGINVSLNYKNSNKHLRPKSQYYFHSHLNKSQPNQSNKNNCLFTERIAQIPQNRNRQQPHYQQNCKQSRSRYMNPIKSQRMRESIKNQKNIQLSSQLYIDSKQKMIESDNKSIPSQTVKLRRFCRKSTVDVGIQPQDNINLQYSGVKVSMDLKKIISYKETDHIGYKQQCRQSKDNTNQDMFRQKMSNQSYDKYEDAYPLTRVYEKNGLFKRFAQHQDYLRQANTIQSYTASVNAQSNDASFRYEQSIIMQTKPYNRIQYVKHISKGMYLAKYNCLIVTIQHHNLQPLKWEQKGFIELYHIFTYMNKYITIYQPIQYGLRDYIIKYGNIDFILTQITTILHNLQNMGYEMVQKISIDDIGIKLGVIRILNRKLFKINTVQSIIKNNLRICNWKQNEQISLVDNMIKILKEQIKQEIQYK